MCDNKGVWYNRVCAWAQLGRRHLAFEEGIEAVRHEESEDSRVFLFIKGVECCGDVFEEAVLLGKVVVFYYTERRCNEKRAEAAVPYNSYRNGVLEACGSAGASELEDKGLYLRESNGAAEHSVNNSVANRHAIALKVPHT